MTVLDVAALGFVATGVIVLLSTEIERRWAARVRIGAIVVWASLAPTFAWKVFTVIGPILGVAPAL